MERPSTAETQRGAKGRGWMQRPEGCSCKLASHSSTVLGQRPRKKTSRRRERSGAQERGTTLSEDALGR